MSDDNLDSHFGNDSQIGAGSVPANEAHTSESNDGPSSEEAASFSFFMDQGAKKLLQAMLIQSIRDCATNQAKQDAPAEIAMSARWIDTVAGRECIALLIPDASASHVAKLIKQNPAKIVSQLEAGFGGIESSGSSGFSGARFSSISLTDEVQTAVSHDEERMNPAWVDDEFTDDAYARPA
jgi:hypothetical protein